jgi:hypothetical protein
VDGHELSQLRHACRGLAIDFLLEPTRPIRHSDAPRCPFCQDFAEYGEPVATMLNQPAHLTGSKRTPAPKHKDPFEQARLSGPVGSIDEVALRMKVELHLA